MDVPKVLRSALRRFLGEATSGARNPAQWFVDWVRGGAGTDSGVVINGKTALEYPPVWYAVNKIAGNLAQMPLVLNVREGDRGRRRAVEHPHYRLLKKEPNSLMTASVFKETLMAHALLQGNGRAAILRNRRADAEELIPLLPDRTVTVVVDGVKWHVTTITREDGSKETRKLRDVDVLHIPGLGYDGITGYSLIDFARNSWGLGLASEKTSNHHFKNDAMPGAVLQAPPGMFRDEDAANRFLANFRKWHEGIESTSRIGMLLEGMTITPMAINGRDAQWIDQRKFQRQEAALWFLLEQILGDDSSVSYNSLAEKNLAYLTNCLNRWLVKWEEECDRKLLREREKYDDSHYWKFVTGALLKSDTKTTMDTGAIAITNRIMCPNEVREWFELNPYEGGDEFVNPAITPGAGTNEADDEDPAGVDDTARTLIVNRLQELIAVETKRVTAAAAAAAKGANFVRWVNDFYGDDRFPATLCRVFRAVGGDDWQARDYARVSREQLIEACGHAKTDTLAAAVTAILETWPARAEQLADEILSLEASAA